MWNLKATLENVQYVKGQYLVTFATNSIDGKPEKLDYQLSVDIKKYHPPKSTNANSYYWKLISLISDELSKQGTYTSVARIHNTHLRTMWQEIMKCKDGVPITLLIPNTDKAELDCMEDADTHLMPVPVSLMKDPIYVNSKGKEFRWYIELRGCRSFDSKEFTRLTNLAVQDAKDLGIKTLDDYELERLE